MFLLILLALYRSCLQKVEKKYNLSDLKYALTEIPSTPQVYYEN